MMPYEDFKKNNYISNKNNLINYNFLKSMLV